MHDVCVAGGGIAGAAAIVALARRDLSLLWIRPEAGTVTERYGESLAPAARPILRTLGLEALLDDPAHRPSRVVFSAWGTQALVERHAAVHLEGPGMVLNRAAFDAAMVAAAEASSAQVRRAALASAEVMDGRWHLADDAGGSHQARLLVDATGRARAVARGLTPRAHDDTMVAAYAFCRQVGDDVEPTPATLIETAEHGWWYATLLADGRLAINYYSDPDLLPAALTRDTETWRELIGSTVHIARWIDDAAMAIEGPPSLVSARTTWLERAAGLHDGAPWVAIGDAAAAFDPLSSHGMTTALWGAARLPDLVGPALANGDPGALEAYSRTVAAGVMRFRAQRALIYARERRFAPSAFWSRR